MNDRKEGLVWTVDPSATLQSLLEDPTCPDLLARALTDIPSWQVRSETTVGRTLKASSLAPQWLAALLALGAGVTIQDALSTDRPARHRPASVESEVPLEAWLERRVAGGVTAVHIPTEDSHSHRWGEAHVARTPADEPIVAVFAAVRMSSSIVQDARLALTGVWPDPVRLAEVSDALIGGRLTQDRIEATVVAVEEAVQPQGDYRGSAAYRRAMAGVLTRRALETCAAAPRPGGGS